MKSSLKNMVVVLFSITLIASAGVGAVYTVTEGPIAQAKEAAKTAAIANVLGAFDSVESAQSEVDGLTVTVNTATTAGEVSGYAVETMTKSGFGGVIRLMVGFDKSGKILNINVLEQSETPGLGTKMCDEGNPLTASFVGKNPAQMTLKVKKDGGDVDALTAATISSRAYTDALARAYDAYEQAVGEKPQAWTGATKTAEAEKGAENE